MILRYEFRGLAPVDRVLSRIATGFTSLAAAQNQALRLAGLRPCRSPRWARVLLSRRLGEPVPDAMPVLAGPDFVRRALARLVRRAAEAVRALALALASVPAPEPPAHRTPPDAGPAPPATLVPTLVLAPAAPPSRPGALAR